MTFVIVYIKFMFQGCVFSCTYIINCENANEKLTKTQNIYIDTIREKFSVVFQHLLHNFQPQRVPWYPANCMVASRNRTKPWFWRFRRLKYGWTTGLRLRANPSRNTTGLWTCNQILSQCSVYRERHQAMSCGILTGKVVK